MTATTNHPSFPQPQNTGVALWRYMDLSKYASLLQKRALVFPRTDKLGDPFEGSVPVANAKFYRTMRALAAAGRAPPPWDKVPEHVFEQMETSGRRGRLVHVATTYISCWHSNEAESAAMWRLYSKSSDAVCVRTDYASLVDVLPEKCNVGFVRYLDFNNDMINEGNAFNAVMAKRRSFAHEREVRGVIWDTDALLDTGEVPETAELKEVPVDLDHLVKAVHVSPEAPEWFRDVVANLTIAYGLKVEVLHSELNAKPLF